MHILQTFALLKANGVKGGPSERDEQATKLAVRAWQATLGDLGPEQLEAAVMAFLRDPSVCQWWPQPGILLSRVPQRQAEAVDDSDEVWGRVLAYTRAHAIELLHGRMLSGMGADGEPTLVRVGFQPPWEAPPADVANVEPWQDNPRRRGIRAGLLALGGARKLLELDAGAGEAAARASFRSAYRSSRARDAAIAEDAKVLRLSAHPRAGVRHRQLDGPAPQDLAADLAHGDLVASLADHVSGHGKWA